MLAGSIRDDGPLADTEMDLVAAQEGYAAALTDAKLVLMLSTMLHGIGVGNMLPAWVKVICVDINPAVVTKLADRGSSRRSASSPTSGCSCSSSRRSWPERPASLAAYGMRVAGQLAPAPNTRPAAFQ